MRYVLYCGYAAGALSAAQAENRLTIDTTGLPRVFDYPLLHLISRWR